MSTLLTTTMPTMKSSIEALKKAGVRENAAVMIDDAPETQNYAMKSAPIFTCRMSR